MLQIEPIRQSPNAKHLETERIPFTHPNIVIPLTLGLLFIAFNHFLEY